MISKAIARCSNALTSSFSSTRILDVRIARRIVLFPPIFFDLGCKSHYGSGETKGKGGSLHFVDPTHHMVIDRPLLYSSLITGASGRGLLSHEAISSRSSGVFFAVC